MLPWKLKKQTWGKTQSQQCGSALPGAPATRGKCNAECPGLHPARNVVWNSSCEGKTSLCTALGLQSWAQNDTWGSVSFPQHLCCSTQSMWKETVPSPEVCWAIDNCKFLFKGKGKSSWSPAPHLPLTNPLPHVLYPPHHPKPEGKCVTEQVQNNHWSFAAGMFIVFVFLVCKILNVYLTKKALQTDGWEGW